MQSNYTGFYQQIQFRGIEHGTFSEECFADLIEYAKLSPGKRLLAPEQDRPLNQY